MSPNDKKAAARKQGVLERLRDPLQLRRSSP